MMIRRKLNLYSVCKLKKYDVVGLMKVSDILYKCGKDMAERYDLHHWGQFAHQKLGNYSFVYIGKRYLSCD